MDSKKNYRSRQIKECLVKIISSVKDLGSLLEDLKFSEVIGLDIEASSLDEMTAKLYLIQIATAKEIYVIDCLNFKSINYLLSLIRDKTIVGHNLKYDTKVLFMLSGIHLQNLWDTMLMEVLLDKGAGASFISLEDLVYKYKNVRLDKTVRESFYANGELTAITMEQFIYAAEDVKYLLEIYDRQEQTLESVRMSEVANLENKVLPVVAMMELYGVPFDTVHWKELMFIAEENAKELSKIIKSQILGNIVLNKYKNLHELYMALRIPVKTKRFQLQLTSMCTETIEFIKDRIEEDLNISSPLQMKAILKEVFNIDIESTGEKELIKVAEEYKYKEKTSLEIVKNILSYRENVKKATSFGQTYLDAVRPETGRLHTKFNQLLADSGRFSSSNPVNLQQMPRDVEYRKSVRAPEGWSIVTADYSQQELRIAALFEPLFKQAFMEGKDLHRLTASIMYEIPEEEVKDEQRLIAKGWNFAVLYGSTDWGLAYNFGMEINKATIYLDKWKNAYKNLSVFKTKFEDMILKRGFSATLYGRRRYFKHETLFADSTEAYRFEALTRRQGFNHLIQGTGADINKLALVRIFYANPFGDKLQIIMTIHDEIVCLVHNSVLAEAKKFIETSMADAESKFIGDIPALVDVSSSEYWGKEKK
jgi:DNA polymerase-1